MSENNENSKRDSASLFVAIFFQPKYPEDTSPLIFTSKEKAISFAKGWITDLLEDEDMPKIIQEEKYFPEALYVGVDLPDLPYVLIFEKGVIE